MLTISFGLGRKMSGRLGLILQAGTMGIWSCSLASQMPVLSVFSTITCMSNKKRVSFRPTHLLPGLIIAPGRVQMDPAKVSAVAEWPTPDSCKEVQQFLGFTNFYGRFIRGFNAIAAPLQARSRPSSAHPHSATLIHSSKAWWRLTLEGFGAVLSQRSELDGKMHPCTFLSRRLRSTRWALFFNHLHFRSSYRRGSRNIKPDTLSSIYQNPSSH